MKRLRTIAFLLVAAACCNVALADGIKDQLVRNVWKMERQTGMGDVTTVWLFFEDDSGVAYQKLASGNEVSTYNHRFTYEIDKGRVIVQEDIEEKWKGHFGVTRWRFAGNRLIGEVKFRNQALIFTTIDL